MKPTRLLPLLVPLLPFHPTTAIKLLLPLYLYPGENAAAWSPITDTIRANPCAQFEIVLNPMNGPGPSTADSPEDKNHLASIALLNTFPNVHTTGYVLTGHGSRSPADVKKDIDTYASWASHTPENIAVGGIYFDEVSSEKTQTNYDYYSQLTSYARTKFSSSPNAQMIFNPGYRAPEQLFAYCDLMVEFEDSYANYKSQGILAQIPEGFREKSAVQIYSSDPEGADVEGVTAELEMGGVGAVFFGEDCCYKVWNQGLLGRMAAAVC